MRTSNLVENGEMLLTGAQFDELRRHLGAIHRGFRALYNRKVSDQFAMENRPA